MSFDPSKHKKLYQNGLSNEPKNKKSKQTKQSFDEWPILSPTGDLIGFIKLDPDSKLPSEIWIRDKKYKKAEKIHKN